MDPLVIGADRGLRPVMHAVRKAASTDVNVVVRGETGTGKEVVARAIHRTSPRRQLPFVVANCAAIPHELMESELFGHVRGAFTGAVADRAGYFEAAAGGTLLLDEIGDLQLALQAKLLRVVEDRTYRRVGTAETRRNRARLICATNQPLEDLIERRRFRADLFYRLAVLTIDVPPLRRHAVDVPALVAHFVARASRRAHRNAPDVSGAALTRLCTHDWPGNVRELRNVCERLVLFEVDRIECRHVEACLSTDVRPSGDRAVLTIHEAERIAIVRALEHFDGNRTRAAEALGIGRRTLQMKIHAYELEDDAAEADGS